MSKRYINNGDSTIGNKILSYQRKKEDVKNQKIDIPA